MKVVHIYRPLALESVLNAEATRSGPQPGSADGPDGLMQTPVVIITLYYILFYSILLYYIILYCILWYYILLYYVVL